VGDAGGAVSVEALAGNGVAVGTRLAVGAGVSVSGCAVGGLQAAVKPARNKPVKRMFFKMFFMPTLLDKEWSNVIFDYTKNKSKLPKQLPRSRRKKTSHSFFCGMFLVVT
jgi:hypothetical protein